MMSRIGKSHEDTNEKGKHSEKRDMFYSPRDSDRLNPRRRFLRVWDSRAGIKSTLSRERAQVDGRLSARFVPKTPYRLSNFPSFLQAYLRPLRMLYSNPYSRSGDRHPNRRLFSYSISHFSHPRARTSTSQSTQKY